MVAATRKSVRFTVDEYLKMDRAGLFDSKRVELIAGRIHRMHAQANPHRWSVSKCSRTFLSRFDPQHFWVVLQGSYFLNRYSVPEPDLHVFAVPEGTPDELLPIPFIVVEVSDTTYRKDSTLKLALYASAGVRDYWILNIVKRRIEVYRRPQPGSPKTDPWSYADVTHYAQGQMIEPLAYPDISIAVNELLP